MSRPVLEHPEDLRDLFFALLESMPSGILLAGRDGLVFAANVRAAGLLGLVGTSLVDRPCLALLRQALRLSDAEMSTLAASSCRLVLTPDENRFPGQPPRTLAISRSILKSPFAAIAGGFLISIEDITYPCMAELQADRQKRLAAMEEMAETVNQDLKNPLGSIELCASLLSRELADDPDNQRLALQIGRAVRTMDYLLHNYLIFAGLPQPRLEEMALGDWLAWVGEQCRLLDRDGKYKFAIEDGGLGGVRLSADAGMFRLLAVNAVVNAMESMPDGGLINLVARRLAVGGGPNCLELAFCDHGRGIEVENPDRAFDPFFSTKKDGRGMGLSTIHYIVQVHHGLARLENRPAGGACLRVILPLSGDVA